MNPRRNPFHPGAGTPPPELAGRDELLERASVALDRIRAGRGARSFILYGLRGVGKTVLLTTIWNTAGANGLVVVALEASENRSLRRPIEREGERIDDAAIAAILTDTQGYPYFIQEWGKRC
jgi:replication-associated recombination protein RarA